jgi:[ribosomal protein S18]-alanine N-acetyltransferase
VKLRFALEEDAGALEAVHARAFDASWTATDIARLMQVMGGFAFIADEETEGPLGFILARTMAGQGEILTLAVAPWARRRGLGAALVEAAAAEAGRRGAKEMFLEVAADNAAALALYRTAGFAEAGLRRHYYARPGGPSADALVLRRTLNRPAT